MKDKYERLDKKLKLMNKWIEKEEYSKALKYSKEFRKIMLQDYNKDKEVKRNDNI